MKTHTIFAWTGPTPPEGYPAFVNISRDENGVHTIMVRGPGGGGGRLGCAELPPEVLLALVKTLLPPMPENRYSTEAEGDAYTHGWFDGNEAEPYGVAATVPAETWQAKAAAWLRSKADEQEATNRQYPRHAEASPSWVERAKWWRSAADELQRNAGVLGTEAPTCKQATGCPDRQWCGRAGVCLNVPPKPGVGGTDA